MDMVLFNAGADTLTQISVTINFDGDFDLTRLEGYIYSNHTDMVLTLSPTYTTTLAPGQSNTGRICINPIREPATMTSTFTVVEADP